MANIFTSTFSKNVGTTEVSVYTVPASTTTTVIGLSVSNVSNTTVSADVYITRSGVDYYIGKGVNLLSGGVYIPVGGDQKVILLTGDILKVKSNTATSLDVVLSMLNIT